jgi:phenylpyruvate tautomerase PptA (4-oxalocrotonate tautomerase family)
MPIMEVHYAAGRLDKAAKAELAGRLTDLMIEMEGGVGAAQGRAFAWVLFDEKGEDDFWVGGRAGDEFVAAPGKFFVRTLIPEGYMNAQEKSRVHAGVADAILATAGKDGSGASVLVVIEEVTEGNWGARGRTLGLAAIADAVSLPKDGARFPWSRRYFAAKARERTLAGFPEDAGGIMQT